MDRKTEHIGVIIDTDSHGRKGPSLGNLMGCVDSLRWSTPEPVIRDSGVRGDMVQLSCSHKHFNLKLWCGRTEPH